MYRVLSNYGENYSLSEEIYSTVYEAVKGAMKGSVPFLIIQIICCKAVVGEVSENGSVSVRGWANDNAGGGGAGVSIPRVIPGCECAFCKGTRVENKD